MEGGNMKLLDYRLALCISIVLLIDAVFLVMFAYRDIDVAYNLLNLQILTGQKWYDISLGGQFSADEIHLMGLKFLFLSIVLYAIAIFILIPQVLNRGEGK
jgi:hypothetical protein